MIRVYQGPAQVVAQDALLDADAVLIEFDGWWGGFLRMKSVAGAELVQEASTGRHVTVDGSTTARISTRRVDVDSPVLRVSGMGAAPFTAKDIRRAKDRSGSTT